MAKRKIFGLSTILMGPVAADGGMGATLVEVFGSTVKGSASLIFTPGSTTDVEIEESDTPEDVLESAPGKWELAFESYNVGAKTLNDAGIGTYTAGVNPAPDELGIDDIVHSEGSFKVTTKNGTVIELARVKYIASPTFGFDKTKLGSIKVTGTPLQPTKAGTYKIRLVDGNS